MGQEESICTAQEEFPELECSPFIGEDLVKLAVQNVFFIKGFMGAFCYFAEAVKPLWIDRTQ